jgi:putative DNA primase/helicase
MNKLNINKNMTKLEAALFYAKELKLKVFPVHNIEDDGRCSCGKDQCSAGKHPRINGWKELATTDLEQIQKWWTQWPDANIGVKTGKESGIVVVDIDNKPEQNKNGFDSIAKYEEEHGSFTFPDLKAQTPSGGEHWYYGYYPKGSKEIRNSTDLLSGVDIRGEGGYIIAPPSNHIAGGYYKWVN